MSDPVDRLIPRSTELAAPVAALPRASLLLTYQQKALQKARSANLLVIEKSRRIGLTWGLASYASNIAARRKSAGGMDVWYMGYDQEMGREFVDTVGMWGKAFNLAASAAEEVTIADTEKDIKAFRVTFDSGFETVALPSVARSLRGRQGLVIIDEAAFVTNLAEVLKAALALLMWGGAVIVVSTHNGVDNPFNQLIEEIRAGRRKGTTLTITFRDAMAAGLYERICLVKGEKPTEEGKVRWEADIRAIYGDAAAEELDCIPSSGGGSWLPLDLITAAEHPEAGIADRYQGGPCWVGWDVARRKDLSVVWVFEQIGSIRWLRERIEMRGVSFAEQYRRIDEVMAGYRVVRLSVDQTGMGEAPVEEMQRRHGSGRVEGVILSGPRRLVLATHLKQGFEDGHIRLPHDPEIRTDLRAIKRVAGPTGAPRLVEDGDVHPDRFWAAALAIGASADGGYIEASAVAENRGGEAYRSDRARPSQRSIPRPLAAGRPRRHSPYGGA